MARAALHGAQPDAVLHLLLEPLLRRLPRPRLPPPPQRRSWLALGPRTCSHRLREKRRCATRKSERFRPTPRRGTTLDYSELQVQVKHLVLEIRGTGRLRHA